MKNWTRERWRKLYLRENAQQRSDWPVMQRGIRNLCVQLAEDDGTLATFKSDGDPVAVVARVLGSHSDEAALVSAAIAGLLGDGFLVAEDGRVLVRNLPEAQASVPLQVTDPGAVDMTAPSPVARLKVTKSAAERARDYRDRRRVRHADGLGERHELSRNTVTDRHETGRDEPSRNSVTVSRGDSQKEASEEVLESQNSQTNQPNSVTGARDGRHGESVTIRDGNTVTGVRDVQALATAYLRDEFTGSNGGIGGGVAGTWPEVIAVCTAFALAWGNPVTLRSIGLKDPRLKVILERFAEGFTVEQLEQAIQRSRFAEYIANNRANQTLQTILRDAGQIEKFAALTAPSGLRRGRIGVQSDATVEDLAAHAARVRAVTGRAASS